jgi:predicted exporter
MNETQRTEKHEQARNTLPDELKSVFDELVEDYRFATITRYGQGYVAYIVLADLVRVGWRHTVEPLPERETGR